MTDTIIIQRVIPNYRVPLFRELNERFGWRVACAANPPGGTFLDVTERHDFADYFECRFADPTNEYACQFPVSDMLAATGAKRVIAEFSMQNNLGRLLPQFRSKGLLDSFAYWTHGWNMAIGFGNPREWARQYGRLWSLSRADLILTYTEEGKDWVEKWLPLRNVLALGNALDVDEIRKVASTAKPDRHGSPQLLSVGRLNAEKKYHSLIALFRKLKIEFPDAALTIIGDGPERSNLEALAATFSDGSVRLPGAIRDEAKLAPHFLGSDFFILTGAAGLSVNHALAYGVPVIAYARVKDVPHNGPEIEYVKDGKTGLLCRDASPDGLYDVICSALAGDCGAALRRQIPQFVDANMHINNVVNQFGKADGMF